MICRSCYEGSQGGHISLLLEAVCDGLLLHLGHRLLHGDGLLDLVLHGPVLSGQTLLLFLSALSLLVLALLQLCVAMADFQDLFGLLLGALDLLERLPVIRSPPSAPPASAAGSDSRASVGLPQPASAPAWSPKASALSRSSPLVLPPPPAAVSPD